MSMDEQASTYHNKINQLGATRNPHLCVVTFINGTTINCKLRLGMEISCSPESKVLSSRVNTG